MARLAELMVYLLVGQSVLGALLHMVAFVVLSVGRLLVGKE